jgi:hypothetical protein
MEYWNNGERERRLRTDLIIGPPFNIPMFQYSNLPRFGFRPSYFGFSFRIDSASVLDQSPIYRSLTVR